MAYTRIDWKNGEAGNTPLNANNLNRMDEAIAELDERAGDSEYNFNSLEARVTQAETNLNGKMNKNNPVGNGILTIDAINTQALTSMDVDTNDLEVSRISGKNGVIIATDDITVDGIPTPIGSLANTANTRSQEAETRANSAYNRASDAIGDAVIAMNRANENKAKIDLHTGLIGEGVGDKWSILSYLDGYYIAPNGSVTQYNATATVIGIDFLDSLFSGDNIIFNHVDLLPTENCIPCAWYDISGNFISAADGLNVIAEIDEQTFKITKHYIDYCIIPVPAGASSCKLSGLANGRADIRIQTSLSEAIKELQSKPETAPLVLTNPSPLPATDGKKILGIDALGKSWQGGTPTPENVIPITDANPEVIAIGKNLLDVSKNTDKRIILDNGSINTNDSACASDFIELKSGQYTFTSKKATNNGTVYIRVHAYDADKNWMQMIFKSTDAYTASGNYSGIFTMPTDAKYIRICWYRDNADSQLEIGTTSSAYEAYQSNSVSLPFVPKSAGSAANEFIIYEDGTGKIIQRVETFTPTTAEQYGADANNGNYCLIKTPKNVLADLSSVVGISDKLVGKSYNDRHSDINISRLYRAHTSYTDAFWIQLAKGDTTFTSEASAIAFVKTLTIQYALATPIEISLTAEEVAAVLQLMTYMGTTIVESEMDIKSVTYPGDIKAYVDDKFVYSYTIRKIGKWADNKDLYQIIVNTTTPSANADGLISNIINGTNCSIKKMTGIIQSADSVYVPISDYYNSGTFASIWIDSGGIKLRTNTAIYANKPCEITVEFTYKDGAAPAMVMSLEEETEE